MKQWLANLFGGNGHKAAVPARRGGAIVARYDNAATTDENQRNWIGSDYLSAKAANSFNVRRILRTRSRYEVSNNPYLFGIVNSNADDLINTGPTLQLRTDNDKYNARVEKLWAEWWEEVGGVDKLRTCKLAKTIDGEGFTVLKTYEKLESLVKLYPVDIEADQVTNPAPANLTSFWVDGLTLDPVTGQPESYSVLKHHPGDFFFPDMNPLKTETIPAANVIQWFNKFRPGQVRGVPTFTSALDLFTQLRAFRIAVLNNVQLSAAYTAVLESQYSALDDGDVEIEAFKRVAIDRGMMATLPAGVTMKAFDSKQPGTTYEMFQEKCLGEACRPLNYPLNLALGTSQKFNFSSAKLDHINYRNGLNVERAQCNTVFLNPLFKQWYMEAVLAGAIEAYDGMKAAPHEWHWPGYESLDPVTDAAADHDRLAAGTLTYREFWARRGYDWRDVVKQQATEKKELAKLGLEFGDPVTRSITETTDANAEEVANAV